jgi:hypothetical protein
MARRFTRLLQVGADTHLPAILRVAVRGELFDRSQLDSWDDAQLSVPGSEADNPARPPPMMTRLRSLIRADPASGIPAILRAMCFSEAGKPIGIGNHSHSASKIPQPPAL